MTDGLLLYTLIGFSAQLVDGALGMAFGVISSSILLSFGIHPAAVSATVHAAECISTGASAASHHAFGNIDRKLFLRLLPAAVLGAILGAYVLSNLSADFIKPYITLYLMLMGIVIIVKAFGTIAPKEVTSHVGTLGFFGALLDVMGGGGWGPIVSTNLIARGNDVKTTIGSVNAAEFFVTLSASATFFMTLGFAEHLDIIVGLALGGAVAAPLAALLCKHVPVKPLMIAVGTLITALSFYNFINIVF